MISNISLGKRERLYHSYSLVVKNGMGLQAHSCAHANTPTHHTYLLQNLKLLVRGVEHTTLLITALSFPDIPDVLVTWLTHGYTPFTVGASLSTIVQRKLSSGSDEPDEEAASGLPSPTGVVLLALSVPH